MKAVLKLPEQTPAEPQRSTGLRVVAAATTVVFLAPLAYLVWESLIGGAIGSGLDLSKVGSPLTRSLVLASCVAVVSAVLGVSLAWVTTRTDIPMRRSLRVAAALPLAIPSYVGAAGLRAAFGQGGLIPWVPRPSGFFGALLVLSTLTYPYVYLPVAARLLGMPGSIEDAATLLGDGTSKIARRIVAPQLRSPVLAGGLIVFLYALSDFGAVSLMRYDTVTRVIYSSRLADRETALLLGLLLGLLAIGVALAERRLADRDSETIFPIGQGRVYRLGAWRIGTFAVATSFLALVLVSPIAVFTVWWRRGAAASGATLAEMAASLRELAEPSANSALAGALAGLVAMVLLLPIAYLVRRGPSTAGTIANVAVASTFALPGLVLALTVVYWVLQAPSAVSTFYQSLPLLILVYVLHFGVQAQRASADAVRALPERYSEAAKMLGAGSIRRFWTVDGPLIAPGVVAGGGSVMLSTLKELPATLLLSPIGFDTLATRIWGASEEGFLAEVGSTSLVLMGLSMAMTWVLVLRPTKLASIG